MCLDTRDTLCYLNSIYCLPFSAFKVCIHFISHLSSLERHDALYVVGALDETLELRGLRYHPIDIETSVSRTHRSIAEW